MESNCRQKLSDPRCSHGVISRAVEVRVRLFSFSILLLSLLALGCRVPSAVSPGSPSETAPGEVSFKLAGANEAALIVPVKINGKGPYDFVLDTGATFTCVDRKLAEELTLPDWSGPLGTVVITGARVKWDS